MPPEAARIALEAHCSAGKMLAAALVATLSAEPILMPWKHCRDTTDARRAAATRSLVLAKCMCCCDQARPAREPQQYPRGQLRTHCCTALLVKLHPHLTARCSRHSCSLRVAPLTLHPRQLLQLRRAIQRAIHGQPFRSAISADRGGSSALGAQHSPRAGTMNPTGARGLLAAAAASPSQGRGRAERSGYRVALSRSSPPKRPERSSPPLGVGSSAVPSGRPAAQSTQARFRRWHRRPARARRKAVDTLYRCTGYQSHTVAGIPHTRSTTY